MLKINNLTYKVENKTILNKINCTFPSASLCCVVGKNGCGKSSLLKAIDRLIETEGEISLNEKDLNLISIKERAKLIAYLPQNRITPSISARLMIEHGRFPYLGFSKVLSNHDKNVVDKVINKTKTKKLLSQNLENMSGGEAQKIYIASTMAQEAKIFLFDEPTTYLDLENQIEVLKLIQSLKKKDTTIIVVLHDLLQAFTFFENIYLMDNGQIIENGTPDKLVKSNNIKRIFKCNIKKEDNKKSLYKYKLIK